MSDSTIVEILLALLAAGVGAGSFFGAGRAERVKAVGVQKGIEANAYARAKEIYEGAIDSLEEQLGRLRDDLSTLQTEMVKLRRLNVELQTQVTELQLTNQRLLAELQEIRGVT